MVPRRDLEDGLVLWLEAMRASTVDARLRFCGVSHGEPMEMSRERALVDEYASVRLLEALAAAERSLAQLLESKSPHVEAMMPAIAAAEERVARALASELDHRAAHAYVQADPSSPALLERYLDRSSQLKKHFQEVLFLEPELVQVAERLRHCGRGDCGGPRRLDVGFRVAGRPRRQRAQHRVARRVGPRAVRGDWRARVRGEGPHEGGGPALDQPQRAPPLCPARRALPGAGAPTAEARRDVAARESCDESSECPTR